MTTCCGQSFVYHSSQGEVTLNAHILESTYQIYSIVFKFQVQFFFEVKYLGLLFFKGQISTVVFAGAVAILLNITVEQLGYSATQSAPLPPPCFSTAQLFTCVRPSPFT